MKKNLQDWLALIESIHPLTMDFKLARIIEVFHKFPFRRIAPLVVTVAGTNGKGSTSTTIAALFQAHGAKVGLFTSPHILQFNERIVINQIPVSDELLIEAFEYVDHIRGDILLTFFEYTTLAAFYLFHKQAVDVAVLEVGLGGRLDATNIIDADLAVFTPIDIDHADILGNSIDLIAREKAGIIKQGAHVISAEINPPTPIVEQARTLAASWSHQGRDFTFDINPDQDTWRMTSGSFDFILKRPNLAGTHQYQNAATAIQALLSTTYRDSVTSEKINAGLSTVTLNGRLQLIEFPAGPQFYFDVTHNPQGAKTLLTELKKLKHTKRILAVFAMLADKEAEGVATLLNSVIDHWIICSLNMHRGQTAEALQERINDIISSSSTAETIADGCEMALSLSHKDDIILVFGSFHTVCEGLMWIHSRTNNG